MSYATVRDIIFTPLFLRLAHREGFSYRWLSQRGCAADLPALRGRTLGLALAPISPRAIIRLLAVGRDVPRGPADCNPEDLLSRVAYVHVPYLAVVGAVRPIDAVMHLYPMAGYHK